ncbi:MAG TPA: Uma2 family endonuclease [Coleofasciculaceae cyanobacterium]|jgi:Uma2 family endonuclease
MFAVITPEKIHLPPGTVVRLSGSWQDYRALVEQLGDRQLPRIKYRPGEILLMSPLPQHGRQADIISEVAKVLLDHSEQDYTAFTPITIDLPEVRGIEPDYCFYIDNWAAIAGKDRIDWRIDPPPDLVIEIDVTSYMDVTDYLPYRVPEVWLFKNNQLEIYALQNDGENDAYVLQKSSHYFPGVDVAGMILECLQMTGDRGTSHAIRSLRRKLADN